jgi:chromosome segregation ATPase
MLMLSDNTAEGREHLRKSIAEAPQKIQTLEQQLIQAKQADEPQRIEREALERTVRRTQFDLENYIAGLSRRKELHTAREAVYPLEREQFKLLTEMEVGNAREAELAELRRKASEIGPEIAKCPSEIQRLEQELASHQTQYADLERQRKALVQQQEELKQRISNLSRDFKQKQTEMESDTAPAQFQEAIKKEQEKLDAAYQSLVQRSIEELSKILLPTI